MWQLNEVKRLQKPKAAQNNNLCRLENRSMSHFHLINTHSFIYNHEVAYKKKAFESPLNTLPFKLVCT